MSIKIGNWTDNPCYYVSVIDGPRYNLLAGPYRTHEAALADVDMVNELAQSYGDPGAWFYSYGTCKVETGHRTGLLNSKLMASVPMGSWTGESISKRKEEHIRELESYFPELSK